MKTERRIFGGIAAFLLAVAIVYAGWTTAELGRIEWIGTVALFLSFALSIMVTLYFWIVERRIEPRPEDRPDAEIAEGAGEVGFFSPGSYFPFGIALACTVAGLGIAFWMWWMIAAGGIGILLAVSGMLFEYYTGTRRTTAQ